jgi:hypothetical protein
VATVAEYVERMHETYMHGSHQAGPMRNISLVGTFQACLVNVTSGSLFCRLIVRLFAA